MGGSGSYFKLTTSVFNSFLLKCRSPRDFVQEIGISENNCSSVLNSAAGNELKDLDKAFP